MKKAKILYEEKTELSAKHHHPRSEDYLNYESTIRIKDRGKQPVEMNLKFIGIIPLVGAMPPKEHTIKASSIVELHLKLKRWLWKYGYAIH